MTSREHQGFKRVRRRPLAERLVRGTGASSDAHHRRSGGAWPANTKPTPPYARHENIQGDFSKTDNRHLSVATQIVLLCANERGEVDAIVWRIE